MTRLVNADKNIAELLRDEIDGSAPRLVTAVESRGHMVRVKFPGEVVAGESWFIATTAGVPVGASGVVIPMRGNAGYFQEIGSVRGATHSYSDNASPSAESIVGVGTYSSAKELRRFTLGDTGPAYTIPPLIPEITEGVWDVDIDADVSVYRSVTTGGVYLFLGRSDVQQAFRLGRNSPQTNAYGLHVKASLKGLSNTTVLDMRYTGQGTAGTTYVVNHGWQIKARRVG